MQINLLAKCLNIFTSSKALPKKNITVSMEYEAKGLERKEVKNSLN